MHTKATSAEKKFYRFYREGYIPLFEIGHIPAYHKPFKFLSHDEIKFTNH
jgi:hypothetical protein